MASSYVDRRDAEKLKKEIFSGQAAQAVGSSSGNAGEAAEAQAAAAAPVSSDAEAAFDAALEDGFASPEADRLFPRPTPEEAAHNLRDLTWGEHIVATRMAAARGNAASYLYGLREAAVFFLDGNSGGVTLGSSGSFAWVDLDRFVEWIRDVVGDGPFAAVLDEKLAAHEAYNDKIETMRQLLDLRMTQYIPYLPSDEDEEAGEGGEAPAGAGPGAGEGADAGGSARE